MGKAKMCLLSTFLREDNDAINTCPSFITVTQDFHNCFTKKKCLEFNPIWIFITGLFLSGATLFPVDLAGKLPRRFWPFKGLAEDWAHNLHTQLGPAAGELFGISITIWAEQQRRAFCWFVCLRLERGKRHVRVSKGQTAADYSTAGEESQERQGVQGKFIGLLHSLFDPLQEG